MERKVRLYNKEMLNYEKFFEIFQGWGAYANWADSNRTFGWLFKKITLN